MFVYIIINCLKHAGKGWYNVVQYPDQCDKLNYVVAFWVDIYCINLILRKVVIKFCYPLKISIMLFSK